MKPINRKHYNCFRSKNNFEMRRDSNLKNKKDMFEALYFINRTNIIINWKKKNNRNLNKNENIKDLSLNVLLEIKLLLKND